MPNWCENDLYISGPKKRVQEALALIGATREKPEFDFNTLIPYPERFREMDAKAEEAQRADPPDYTVKDGFNQGGYEWCVKNWGTKWNGGDLTRSGNHWFFDTAWAPPVPVIRALIHRFPDLKIKLNYFEGGCAFKGGISHNPKDHAPTDDLEFCIEEWQGSYRGNRGG